MNVEVKLQYCDAPQREAVAWLIPGNSAQAWLTEIATWQVSLVAAKLLIVGRADDPVNNAGLLVILDGKPTVSARCHRYGRVGERLYISVEGQLWPEVQEQQLSSWLPSANATYIWHPTLGLLSIEPHQVLKVSDLIAPPLPSATAWDRAEPGVAPNRRLVSIQSDAPPTIDQILENGREDIGSQADQPNSLPPHPAERSALGRVGESILGTVAGAMQIVIHALQPARGQPSALLAKLRHWAERQVQRHSESLQAERNKALARLVEMLDKNPDEGLKHALPLTGDGSSRGLAPPSSQLYRHDVDFRLGGWGGGRAADPWDAGAYHTRLVQRYRLLANRELNLGRYRRAAYIYAELLGDLRSAAQALEQGTYYSEAAILYDQRLSAPHEAARCYEAGGLWADAVTILERLGEHEKVGDLYSKLNDRDRAAQAYELAIAREIEQGDYLDAARLIEYRLQDPQRAYSLLVESWPLHPQAMRCMKEAFCVLARHQWHDEAARQVRELPRSQWASPVPVVEQLAAVAREYPVANVRALAADQTRSLAGKHLPTAVGGDRCALADAVRKLVPEDRLLARDTQRYLREQSALTATVARRDVVRKQGLRIVETHQLPSDVEWMAAGECHGTLLVIGWRRNGLVVGRINAAFSAQQFAEVPSVRRRGEGKLLLAVPPHPTYKVLIHQIGDQTACADWQFPFHPEFVEAWIAIGSHSSASADTVGLHSTLQGMFSLEAIRLPQHREIDRLLIREFSPSGSAWQASYEINLVERTGHLALEPLLTAASGASVYVGSGAFFIAAMQNTQPVTTQLPLKMTAMQVDRPGDLAALSFEHGVLVMSLKESTRQYRLVSDWTLPVTGFLQHGELAIASEHGVLVACHTNRQQTIIGELERRGPQPLAVLPTAGADQFLVVYQDGRIERYQITR